MLIDSSQGYQAGRGGSGVGVGCTGAGAFRHARRFSGAWIVKHVVGSSNVGSFAKKRRFLGSRVLWTGTEVTDAEGVCKTVHPAMHIVSYPVLQQDIWAGQTIADLSLPKRQLRWFSEEKISQSSMMARQIAPQQ